MERDIGEKKFMHIKLHTSRGLSPLSTHRFQGGKRLTLIVQLS